MRYFVFDVVLIYFIFILVDYLHSPIPMSPEEMLVFPIDLFE